MASLLGGQIAGSGVVGNSGHTIIIQTHFMQVLAPTCSPGKFRCRSRIHSATSGAVTVICQADTDQLGQVKARLVEGTEVLVEGGKVGARQVKEEGVRLTAEVKLPSLIVKLIYPKSCLLQVQHTDWVTDLATCETTQTLLVSSSNDGCIKVWK